MIEDEGPPPGNPWRGYQLCLRSFLETDWTHAVVIQDDTIVCQNFTGALRRLLEVVPDHPVVLFYPGLRMRGERSFTKAYASKKTLFTLSPQDFLPVVAVLWPRAKAEHFLNWAKDAKLPGNPHPRSDDAVGGSWVRFTRQQVFVTIPSLVEHPDDVDPVKDGPQKAGHGSDKGRIARLFCTGDPLEIEWRF